MFPKYIRDFLPILLSVILLCGCEISYVVTRNIKYDRDFQKYSCTIGPIFDKLPIEMETIDKPTYEDIEELKIILKSELSKSRIFSSISINEKNTDFIVTGSILYYKNEPLVNIVIALELKNLKSGEVVYSGNFRNDISHLTHQCEQVFKFIAKNFAKALKKEIKKLSENNKG